MAETPDIDASVDEPEQDEPEQVEPQQDETELHDTPEESGEVSDDPVFDPARELKALETILAKTRRAWERPIVVEGVMWFVATLGAVAISACLVSALAPTPLGAAIAGWVLKVGAAASALAGLGILIRWLRRTPDHSDTGALLQRHVPELKNDVVAALQFARELQNTDVSYSREMASEHVRKTTRKLLGMTSGDGSLVDRLPRRDTTPAIIAVAACLAVLTAIALVSEPTVQRVFLGAGVTGEESGEQEKRQPLVGDIDLHLTYPPYTDLQARFEAYTTGHIETLVGTDVTLRTYPLFDAQKYEIVMQTDEGERTIPVDQRSGGLTANFLATREGTYQFRATLNDGTVINDGIDRTIRLRPDEAPKITVNSPGEEVEVSPEDIVVFELSVTDDYGVESITRAHAFQGEDPQRAAISVPELAQVPAEVDTRFEFDLRPLSLQPKDIVVVHFEASDNNTLTGPGTGKSRQIVLRVASPEDKHMRIIAEQQAVLEALLISLADFLEAPVGERIPNANDVYEQRVPGSLPDAQRSERFSAVSRANTTLGEVLGKMSETVERMKQDPLMLKRDFEIFSALHEELYELQRDMAEVSNRYRSRANSGTLAINELQVVASKAAEIEDVLEKGLLRLEDLLASQKMAAIESTAEEIDALKERLKELLLKYKETRDPELKKAIEREIKRLRQRMNELMQRMQSQLQKLPQDHVNLEAVKSQQLESDSQQLADNMQSIEDLLDKGDIDGALEALERMGENLDAMNSEMSQQFGQAQPEGLSELDKKLSELMDEVNDLETMQRGIEEDTSKSQQEALEKQRKKMERMLEDATRELKKDVKALRRDADRLENEVPRFERRGVRDTQRQLESLEQSLEAQDIEQALERAQQSVEELKSQRFSLELSQKYARQGSKQARQTEEALERLDGMVERGAHVERELETMMEQARQQLSQADKQQLQQLQQRQNQATQRGSQLQRSIEDAGEQFPMIKQELEPQVGSASESMKKAEESLQKRQTQKALDEQRTALDQLQKLKKSMQQTLQKQRMKGRGREQRRERVEIPGEDKRQEGERFRKDVMQNMREGRLEDYSDEIERYYRSLME